VVGDILFLLLILVNLLTS